MYMEVSRFGEEFSYLVFSTIDAPRVLFDLLDALDGIGLTSLVRTYLGERPVLSADKCTLRRGPPALFPRASS